MAVSVQTEEQCLSLLPYPYIHRIYVDCGAFEAGREAEGLARLTRMVHEAGKKLFYTMPQIVRGSTADWYETHLSDLVAAGIDGIVAGSYDALALALAAKSCETGTACGTKALAAGCGGSLRGKENPPEKLEGYGVQRRSCMVLADSSLYAWSAYAAEALREAGADEVTLPVELNMGELLDRSYDGGELLVYGYLPLMVSAQCLAKNTAGCREKTGYTLLTDRYGKHFAVKNQCRYCYNVLYNTSPLSLLHQWEAAARLQAGGYRISFTRENRRQREEILAWYEQGFLGHEKIDRSRYLADFTNGHFKRGVE